MEVVTSAAGSWLSDVEDGRRRGVRLGEEMSSVGEAQNRDGTELRNGMDERRGAAKHDGAAYKQASFVKHASQLLAENACRSKGPGVALMWA